jgi:hypothetical protein
MDNDAEAMFPDQGEKSYRLGLNPASRGVKERIQPAYLTAGNSIPPVLLL